MGEPAESEEQEYFHSIEDAFIELRGAPLLLSPTDWQIAMGWRARGIPAQFVIGALREVFEKRAEKGSQGRVSSLRYVRKKVEGDWGEAQELLAPAQVASSESLELGGRLRALAAALPSDWSPAAELRRRVVELDGASEKVEKALAALDSEMLDLAARTLDDDQKAKVLGRSGKRVQAMAERLDPKELSALQVRFEHEEIRREKSLPFLSLFSDEAKPA